MTALAYALGGGVPVVFRGSSSKGLCLPFAFRLSLFLPTFRHLARFLPHPASRFVVRLRCGTNAHHPFGGRAALPCFQRLPSTTKRRFAARLLWQPRPITAAASYAIHSLHHQQHRPGRHELLCSSYLDLVVSRVDSAPVSPARSLLPSLPRQHSFTTTFARSSPSQHQSYASSACLNSINTFLPLLMPIV
jgi:hypothetical protein